MYKYGIPFRVARNWLRNNRIYKIISEDEKINLLDEHSETQHLHSNISESIFECMQNFYRSKHYDKLAYIELLDDQNYWWWRQHFTELNNLDDRPEIDSNKDPLWWKQQVIFPGDDDYAYRRWDDDDDDDDSDQEEIDHNTYYYITRPILSAEELSDSSSNNVEFDYEYCLTDSSTD